MTRFASQHHGLVFAKISVDARLLPHGEGLYFIDVSCTVIARRAYFDQRQIFSTLQPFLQMLRDQILERAEVSKQILDVHSKSPVKAPFRLKTRLFEPETIDRIIAIG